MKSVVDEFPDNSGKDPLTCIHPSYTLAATLKGETSEVDDLMIRHFLNTLAEIAFAVASRKGASQ